MAFGQLQLKWPRPPLLFRARLLGGVVALMGVVNIASAIIPGDHPRLLALRRIIPEPVSQSSRTIAVVIGFLLMTVAWNLTQRKREAWLIAAWLLVASIFSHLIKGLDYEEALVAFLLLSALFVFRDDFDVRSDPRSIRAVLYAAPFLVACYVAYALAGFAILQKHLVPDVWDPALALQEAGRRLLFSAPYLYAGYTMQARWFLDSLGLFGLLGAAYVLFTILRPVLEMEASLPVARDAARRILAAHGLSGIAYWAQTPDKLLFFNADYSAFVAYVLAGDIALTAGDPIGPLDSLPGVIRAYRQFCERQDWSPAFYQTRAALLPHYQAAGFETLKIGEEALLDLPAFSLAGKARSDLRAALNRGQREGWTFRFFAAPVDDVALLAQLEKISAEWLSQKVGGELGFVSGGTPLIGDAYCRTSVVHDQAGQPLAVCTWVPLYAARGWGLDLMRRATAAPNGVIEFMIARMALHLQESGEQLLSLGLAPLHGLAEGEARTLLTRGLELVYERAGRVYHFESLYTFKKKFDPRWEDRHLIYASALALPKVLLGVVRAQAPYLTPGEIVNALRRNP